MGGHQGRTISQGGQKQEAGIQSRSMLLVRGLEEAAAGGGVGEQVMGDCQTKPTSQEPTVIR